MLYILMFAHWVGDFVLQSGWMALNKGRCWKALLAHVCVYAVVLGAFAAFLTASWTGLACFVGANFVLHLLVDSVTARMTMRFWQFENKRRFFLTLGFDQFLHFLCLAATGARFLA